jgi:hypothetical protein
VKTYLGRPWRDFSAVTWLSTDMSDVVRPEGWNNWKRPDREKTARYAEYNSFGLGVSSSNRVSWARQLTDAEAKAITVEKVLAGTDGWNPSKTAALPLSTTTSSSFTPTNATFKTDIGYGRLNFLTTQPFLFWEA